MPLADESRVVMYGSIIYAKPIPCARAGLGTVLLNGERMLLRVVQGYCSIRELFSAIRGIKNESLCAFDRKPSSLLFVIVDSCMRTVCCYLWSRSQDFAVACLLFLACVAELAEWTP